MSFLKNLFKKKEGGTFVGNLIRGTVKTAGAVLGAVAPVAGFAANLVSKVIPDAPQSVQQVVDSKLTWLAGQPATDADGAREVAADLKSQLLNLGATTLQASAAGASAFAVASVPPAQAPAVLATAAASMPSGGASFMSGEEVKSVFNAAVKGAKDGAVNGYLDETESGKQTMKEAVDAKGTAMMPYILLAGVVALLISGARQRR